MYYRGSRQTHKTTVCHTSFEEDEMDRRSFLTSAAGIGASSIALAQTPLAGQAPAAAKRTTKPLHHNLISFHANALLPCAIKRVHWYG
jgi:hypothetical protein